MCPALAQQVRSGLGETFHDGAVAVVGTDGELTASSGDIDRPFFIRSSAKPFQAAVSQDSGAELGDLEMAIACASHRGLPAHIALVSSVLEAGGLDEAALQCPPSWPLSPVAARMLVSAGETSPRRIWHNCSGKHAGFLRACVARGWPIESYLSPDHPLQRRVIEFMAELGEYRVTPVGVDGCGAPVLRTTVRAMALMYQRLATESRFSRIFKVMHRYPALVGGNGAGDTEIAIATNSASKGGAAGCIGVAVEDRLGIAAKSWDGLGVIANIAAVSTLDQIGVLTATAATALEPVLRPPVLGGGIPVGTYESLMELEWT